MYAAANINKERVLCIESFEIYGSILYESIKEVSH